MLSIWIRGRKTDMSERASESKSRDHLSKWLKLAKMLRLPSNHHYIGKNIIIYNTIMKQSLHASSKWLYFGRKLHNFEQWRANFVGWASGKRRVSVHRIHQNHFIFREMRHWIYIMVVFICFDGSMMMLTFTRIAFLLIILDFCLSHSFRPIAIKYT